MTVNFVSLKVRIWLRTEVFVAGLLPLGHSSLWSKIQGGLLITVWQCERCHKSKILINVKTGLQWAWKLALGWWTVRCFLFDDDDDDENIMTISSTILAMLQLSPILGVHDVFRTDIFPHEGKRWERYRTAPHSTLILIGAQSPSILSASSGL